MSAQIREDSRRYSSTFRIVFLRRGLASLLVASMSDRERVGMKESEFYPSLPLRPFRTEDAQHYEYQLFRGTALSDALWGRNSDGLERQLLTPHPEIPSAFALADFRELFTPNLSTSLCRFGSTSKRMVTPLHASALNCNGGDFNTSQHGRPVAKLSFGRLSF